jgi:hypothetical protein
VRFAAAERLPTLTPWERVEGIGAEPFVRLDVRVCDSRSSSRGANGSMDKRKRRSYPQTHAQVLNALFELSTDLRTGFECLFGLFTDHAQVLKPVRVIHRSRTDFESPFELFTDHAQVFNACSLP